MSITRCRDYDLGTVEAALLDCLAPLGGMRRFVPAGGTVVVKPNLLMASSPDKAVTTHPAVVEAVVRAVNACGGHVVIADNPNASIPNTTAGLERLYRNTGMVGVAERTGSELNFDTEPVEVPYPDGRLVKTFRVTRVIAEANAVITLPKLKTHTLTGYTGAVKVVFGALPGIQKTGYHGAMHKLPVFSQMLLDLLGLVKPCLTIMDAIVGMDGNGPSAGRPVPLGLLLASEDSVSLDVVATNTVGMDPVHVHPIPEAMRMGLWSGNISDIPVAGVPLAEAKVSGFNLPKQNTLDAMAPPLPLYNTVIRPLLAKHLTLRPVPKRIRCTACGACSTVCPENAIRIVGSVAVVDHDRCISCYCCHESCPESAIDLEPTFFGSLVLRFSPIR